MRCFTLEYGRCPSFPSLTTRTTSISALSAASASKFTIMFFRVKTQNAQAYRQSCPSERGPCPQALLLLSLQLFCNHWAPSCWSLAVDLSSKRLLRETKETTFLYIASSRSTPTSKRSPSIVCLKKIICPAAGAEDMEKSLIFRPCHLRNADLTSLKMLRPKK